MVARGNLAIHRQEFPTRNQGKIRSWQKEWELFPKELRHYWKADETNGGAV
jgi:hypothetical protein